MSEALLNQALDPLAVPGQPVLEPASVSGSPLLSIANRQLETMADVPVTLTFEVARLQITIRQLLELKHSSILALPLGSLDNIRILIDGELIALGDVTALEQHYGIRIEEFLADDVDAGAESQ